MKNKTKTAKKLLAIVLSLVMVISTLPAMAVTAVSQTVSVSGSFTVSTDGSRGNGKLEITSDGGSGNTSFAVIGFDDVSALADATSVKLKFYSYSCSARNGSTVEVYPATANLAYIQDKLTGANVRVTDSSIMGSTFTGTAAASSIKSYFGLNTLCGSFAQPSVTATSGTNNTSIDVTSAVRNAASAGTGAYFVLLIPTAKNGSSSNGWSDVYISGSSAVLEGTLPDTAVDTVSLETAIRNYEAKIAEGKYYTNLAQAFSAYNQAKRYYDAVNYGGYIGNSASYYASQLQTQVNNMTVEKEFIDYCSNVTVTANRTTGQTVPGTNNLIYFPWALDFKAAYTDQGNWGGYTADTVVFKYSLPNFIVGIDGNEVARVPYHVYFFKTGYSPYVESVKINHDNATMKKFALTDWKVGSATVSNGSNTTTLNAFGTWGYESPSTSKTFAGNTTNYGNSSMWQNSNSNMINQASAYIESVNSEMGLTASNNSGYLDLQIQFKKNGKSGYTHSASEHGCGYAYYVYMTDYNANYQNWKSIIPNLTYANYNGYQYNTYSQTATAALDTAAGYSLSTSAFSPTGQISSAVDAWADNIQNAATALSSAKTNANSATKISSYYIDLKTEIGASDAIYAAGQKCYTDASWNTFVTAYENARAHMSALSPETTNSQYSTNNNTVYTLFANLNDARNGLKLKSIDDTCHTWTETGRSPATCEADGSASYQCNVCAQTKTVTLTALGHSYTSTLHSLDNGTHNWLCANGCGTYGTPTGGKDTTEDCNFATFEKKDDTEHTKTCSVCGYSTTENHIWELTGETPADECRTDGKREYICQKTGCGATKEEIIPAAAHTLATIPGSPATCTAPGKTDGSYCTVCYKIIVPQEEIPAKGHQNITTVEAVTPTCTTAGNIEYYVCDDCGAYFSDAGATSEITDKNSVVVAASGHEWNDGEITTPANCVDTGVKTYTCNVCDDTRTETIDVDSTNHKTVVTDAAVAPTCTETGLTEGSHCSACNTVIVAQEEVPALGHSWGAWTYDNANKTHTRVCTRLGCSESQSGKCSFTSKVVKDANCLNAGTTLYTCSVCSGTYTEEIPQLDHDYSGPTKSNGDGTHSYLCKNGCAQYGGTEACSGGTATCIAKATCEVCGYGYGEFAEHAWDSGTVKTPATCTSDGTMLFTCTVSGCDATKEESISASGHTEEIIPAVDATCTETGLTEGKKCSVCGEILVAQEVVPAKGHAWGEWTVVDAATCTKKGSEKRVCANDASHVETREITATGHNYVATVTDPTCTEDGYTTHTCSVCGDTYTDTPVDALGHSFTNYVSNNDATCTEDGTKTAKCDRCDVTDTIPDVGSAKGHAWSEWTVVDAATCTANGSEKRVCSNDESHVETREITATGHNYVATVTDPTCTEDGYTTHTCSVCGDTYTDTPVDALGHSFTNYVSNNDATCTEDGTKTAKCDRCDVTDTIADVGSAKGHAWGEWTVVDAATCTKKGSEKRVCANDASHVETREIDMIAHTEEIIPAVPATCETTGLTEGKKCSVCGKILVAQEVVPAKGHAWGEWTVVDAATCTKKGSEKRVCANDASHVETREIDMIAHTEEIIPAVPATCETTGLTEGKKCSVCGEILVAQEVVPAKGHNWGEWTVVDAATCTKKGSEKRVCANDASHVETREIDMIAHTEEIIPAVDATCTETGLTEGVKCSVCGEILVAQEVVPAKGHNWGEWTVVDAATCTEKGSEKRVCANDASHVETREIDMIAHTEEVIPAVPATCTTTGLTEGKKCSVCGEILVAQEVIPATGHTEEIIPAVEATCTTTGLTEGKKCSVCGEILVAQEVVPMKAHTPAAAVVENKVDATCLAEGSYDEVVYCSVCGEELSRNTVTIPVTDHNIVSRVDIAPTCTTDGKSSETYCSVCGTIISSGTIIPALGHDVTDEVFKSGASDDGSYAWKTYKCSRCDYKLVTLTLSIYDENGNPLSGANVIIRDADGNIVSQGTSNEYGKYVVAGLPEGAYTVEVSHEASSNVGKGTLVVSNGSVNGTYTEGGRLWNPSGTGGCKGCACHHNNIVSYLIRIFFSIISLIFNKDIKCCPDMVWYPGIK